MTENKEGTLLNFSVLDNPGWHSLNSHHRHLAIRGEIAARYKPEVTFGAAMPNYDRAGFEDLGNLVAADEVVALIAEEVPTKIPGWEIVQANPLSQMVCEQLQPAEGISAVELGPDDVPEMMDLVALTEPGPFTPGTIKMGQYFGIREEGQLVAMAGQRLHPPGFCEISAVCTHPDYRGRGYGGGLTTLLAQKIAADGEIPFLHHVLSNAAAERLYRKLGFRKRKEVSVVIMRRSTL